MNLFFKLLFVLLLPMIAEAIQVNALYSASCKREIGVILQVKENHVVLLNLNGKIKQVPRFGIIYWTNYPMDTLPVSQKTEISKVSSLKIDTRVNNSIRHLVTGWPIGYTKDKISLLTLNGTEVAIDRRSIWDVELSQSTDSYFSRKNFREPIKFEHPYIFRNCQNTTYPRGQKGKPRTVYPQEILSNEIMIKRELDLLENNYNYVKEYIKEKRFYPVPEVYKNLTSLGLWLSVGSRYGASSKRSNNLSPLLTNEYSSDVFNYQSKISTGNGPMEYSVHNEIQSHVMYGFKASYFHLKAMVDPNLVLVGENYKWQSDDFDREADDRVNDQAMVEVGFDFGHWNISFVVNHAVSLGTVYLDDVFSKTMSLGGIGISYQNHLYFIEIRSETGSLEEFTDAYTGASGDVDLDVLRINFTTDFWKKYQLQYSLIFKDYSYDSRFTYKSSTVSNAAYLYYKYNTKYTFAGFVSMEDLKNSYGAVSRSLSDSASYLKAGGFISLSF